ncbi:phosphotransferase [Paenibacillus sp. LHD-117]|uniref:phosphotransferase enzyme family protein n=1 Tax=Paenibacillus sp. LHD-117 TaxID=3071412 RepID=UPI0027E0A9AB|nr:phosphotransferase [Paenibacillus sp. LHD-117]MDQ6423123.1 phosphotransferase [Paenibacillus sp. LHD-117]
MIKEITEQYHPGILEEAGRRFGVVPERVKDLGGFESYVYEYTANGADRILKITHQLRRTENTLMGELDFVNYLADGGVPVARAVASEAGRYAETLDNGFLAYAFEKAPGKLAGADDWNDALFEQWGRCTGRMHALTKAYVPSDPAYRRASWREDDMLNVADGLAGQTLIIENAEALIRRISSLPETKDGYGLIHNDLHQKNFFVDNGRMTAFDFDDTAYNYFVNDIAMPLYYALWLPPVAPDDRNAFAKRFMGNFMNGYAKENTLGSEWFRHIHDFMILRHVILYVIYSNILDAKDLSPKEQQLMHRFKHDIENCGPLVELDLERL